MKLLTALLATALMIAGCRGADLAVPAEHRLECPTQPDPENLVAFWRFDDGSTGEEGSRNVQGEMLLIGPKGMLVEDRLGGKGHGALFQGEDSAAGRIVPGTLDVSSDLTLAAWVSLPEDWLAAPAECEEQARALEVVSVFAEAHGQVRLEILHTVGAVPLLRISREVGSDSRERCAVLPSEFGHWGRGRWYHVAGTTGTSSTLHVDGESMAEVRCPELEAAYASRPVSVGQLVAPGGCGFGRLFDDVAVFQPPLATSELPQFLRASHAVLRPDGRWWSVQGVEGSVAEWQCGDAYSPEDGGLQVYFDNKSWSAPRLLVEVEPAPIEGFRRAVVRADIPAGEPFELELEGQDRNHYCVWPAVGRGDDDYEFFAEDVGWCECPGQCPCDFTVRRAAIESRWDTSSRYKVSVAAIDLDFQPPSESGSTTSVEPPPRSLDVFDWCWRPVAYDPTSRARLGSSDAENTFQAHLGAYPSEQVLGTLEAERGLTTFLAADFVGMGAFLNIEGCDRVRLQTTVEPAGRYSLRLVDAYGIVRELKTEGEPLVEIDLTTGETWSPPQVRELGELDASAAEFTPSMVRFVGVQKRWEDEWPATTVQVESIVFETVDGQNCAELTDAKLTAPLVIIDEVY